MDEFIELCESGNQKAVIELIESRENDDIFDAIDTKGRTILMWACLYGMQKLAVKLIKTGLAKPDYVDNKGQTALIHSTFADSELILVTRELIKTGGSKPEHVDKHGMTALMYACQIGLFKTAQLIIESEQSNLEHHDNGRYAFDILKSSFNDPYENPDSSKQVLFNIAIRSQLYENRLHAEYPELVNQYHLFVANH